MNAPAASIALQQALHQLWVEAAVKKASDLHLGPHFPPTLRIHGELEPAEGAAPFTAEQTHQLAELFAGARARELFEERREIDVSVTAPRGERFRVNIYRQRGAFNLAFRFIPAEPPTLKSLGLPPAVEKLAEERRGLILVSGAVGSGKSTTLAAIVDHINSTRKAHILTIEDPIEFLHKNKRSIVNQRELGQDTPQFAGALRAALREDPNVILVGEMRDLETVSTAITAAQTGHLVLSTIHTADTVQILTRILDLYPPHQQAQVRLQLAETLKGVLSQRLLPVVDGSGRTVALEILIATPHVQKSILENDLAEVSRAMREGAFYGMQTFNQSLAALYDRGRITIEEALRATSQPEELMLTIRGVQGGAAPVPTREP